MVIWACSHEISLSCDMSSEVLSVVFNLLVTLIAVPRYRDIVYLHIS